MRVYEKNAAIIKPHMQNEYKKTTTAINSANISKIKHSSCI